MATQEAIHYFWRYVADNVPQLDLLQLARDLPLLEEYNKIKNPRPNLEDFAMRLTTSGVVYMRMSTLFEKITTDVTFAITVNHFELKQSNPLLDQRILENFTKAGKTISPEELPNYKKVFQRYWMVISSVGNPEHFPEIETIYQASKEYKFPDDWQVVKYFPPKCQLLSTAVEEIPPILIPLSDDKIVTPDMLKYDFHTSADISQPAASSEVEQLQEILKLAQQNGGRLEDLPIKPSSLEVSKKDLNPEDNPGELLVLINQPASNMELLAIKKALMSYFINLFGEYLVAKYIPHQKFVVLPEHFFLARYTNHQGCLKPMANFFENMKKYYSYGVSCCTFCTLLDHNVTMTVVGDELPLTPGSYCDYCFGRASYLFSSS